MRIKIFKPADGEYSWKKNSAQNFSLFEYLKYIQSSNITPEPFFFHLQWTKSSTLEFSHEFRWFDVRWHCKNVLCVCVFSALHNVETYVYATPL